MLFIGVLIADMRAVIKMTHKCVNTAARRISIVFVLVVASLSVIDKIA